NAVVVAGGSPNFQSDRSGSRISVGIPRLAAKCAIAVSTVTISRHFNMVSAVCSQSTSSESSCVTPRGAWETPSRCMCFPDGTSPTTRSQLAARCLPTRLAVSLSSERIWRMTPFSSARQQKPIQSLGGATSRPRGSQSRGGGMSAHVFMLWTIRERYGVQCVYWASSSYLNLCEIGRTLGSVSPVDNLLLKTWLVYSNMLSHTRIVICAAGNHSIHRKKLNPSPNPPSGSTSNRASGSPFHACNP